MSMNSNEKKRIRNLLSNVDMTIDGKCSQCGECCGSLLPMTDEEVRSIHRYVKKHGIRVRKSILPTSDILFDMTCPFLDVNKKTEKCMIYEKRPYICRTFLCSRRTVPLEDIDRFSDGKYHVVDMRKEFG